jgi:hypothetical protein
MLFVSQQTCHRPLPEPTTIGSGLESYLAWDHDCTFELAFPVSRLIPLVAVEGALPFEVDISGRTPCAIGDIERSLFLASTSASQLGRFGAFSFGIIFQRKGTNQVSPSASYLHYVSYPDRAVFGLSYRGSGSEVTEEGLQVAEVVRSAGLPIKVEDRSIIHTQGLKCSLSSFELDCDLHEVPSNAHEQADTIIRSLASEVYECSWYASIVDTDKARTYGFELYNRVAASGLTADEIKVLFKLQFLDMRGLDVVRQLCEGQTHYTIPMGTFRHRKKKAILGVFTNKDGHRLSLTLKEAPTEQEWAHLETVLNTKFDRKPFAP